MSSNFFASLRMACMKFFLFFFKLFVCFHDAGNQFMPYNVFFVQLDKTDSFHAFQDSQSLYQPRSL